ncbi:MAG: dephospho-CoA kinase [Cytophagaceae bacterium]
MQNSPDINRTIKVGITGGIGSGKTTVAHIFCILGVPVYDADARARNIMNENQDLKESIISMFGEESYTNGIVNRNYIASQVFNNPTKLKQLNDLVHPKVGEDYEKWHSGCKSVSYTLKEAALLYESGSYKQLDSIIVVACPEEIRIRRVLNRDKYRTREEVENIILRQMSEQDKISKADFIINNDDSQLVIPQVLAIHNQILQKL